MTFKQFRVVAITVCVLLFVITLRSCMCGRSAAPVKQSYAPVAPVAPVQNVAPQVVQQPQVPAYVPPPQPAYVPPQQQVPVQPVQLTADILRVKIEAWLKQNPDRRGQLQVPDILPGEPFRATAIRFKDSDAVKWSNDSRQWSQVKIDVNRDGVYDEKWLLKNGATYKREILNSAGQTTNTEYFQ